MTTQWPTYAVRPLAIGGAGEVLARVDGNAKRVRVLVGASAASGPDDPACLRVDLSAQPDGEWKASFFGALRGLVVASFFCDVAGAWTPGPVVPGIPLLWTADAAFPWVKGWVIARLQEIASERPALPGERGLPVTGAFPRVELNMPALVVQVQGQAQASQLVGDHVGSTRLKRGDIVKRARQYSMSVTVECWALTPEDRDDIARWMGGAMEVLLDACRAQGWEEPSCSLDESEMPGAASPLEIPIFQATARLNLGAWSFLSSPVASFHGRLTVL